MLLSAQNISKTFVKKVNGRKEYISVLENVCFDMDEGQKIAILGKSGEGKSTFARILCGFTKCQGQIYFDGQPLFDVRQRYDRKLGINIQLISQQPYLSLDPRQKVGDAVREVFQAHKIAKGEKAKFLTRVLFDEMGLDISIMDRLPSQLSGGQAQRVAVARAIAVNPKIIILDEATSMLDVSSQSQILEIIDKLVLKGLAVLFISHDEDLVYSFADKVYAVKEGQVILKWEKFA